MSLIKSAGIVLFFFAIAGVLVFCANCLPEPWNIISTLSVLFIIGTIAVHKASK